MSPVLKRNSQRDAWFIAWALTLALHGAMILGIHRFPLLHATPTPPHQPEPVQLVFSPPGPETGRPEKPQFFTELPPDRASARPEKADFLSNVTSRARDRVPGGNATLPRMTGDVDVPMVRLQPEKAPSQPSAAAPPNPQPTGEAGVGATSPSERVPAAAPPASDVIHESPGSAGSSDIQQPEMDNPNGNAALTGDISLNTTAWDYAPWLQRFGRQLMHRWMAPQAYYMGLLKEGGWAVIEVEISRSGKLLRLDLLEEQGHPSLIVAAESALRYMGPIEPLPADFPEPTLILRIRMIYPKIRPR